MKSLKEITKLKQRVQLQLDNDQLLIQREQQRADEYRSGEQMEQAETHDNAALKYQESINNLQAQMDELNDEEAAVQGEIGQLESQKSTVMQEKDAEIARLDDEIVRLRGGY